MLFTHSGRKRVWNGPCMALVVCVSLLLAASVQCQTEGPLAAAAEEAGTGPGAPTGEGGQQEQRQEDSVAQAQREEEETRLRAEEKAREEERQRREEEQRRKQEEERQRQEALRQEAMRRAQEEAARKAAELERLKKEVLDRPLSEYERKWIAAMKQFRGTASFMEEQLPRLRPAIEQLQQRVVEVQAAAAGFVEDLKMRPTELTVAINTVPRGKGKETLLETLESIVEQVESGTLVVVMNHAPGKHEAFAQAKLKYAHSPAVRFVDNTAGFHDPFEGFEAQHTQESTNTGKQGEESTTTSTTSTTTTNSAKEKQLVGIPSGSERQYTCDVASLALLLHGRSRYVMFVEDDTRLCPFALKTLSYVLAKVQLYHPQFTALRVSYGMNGILMHGESMRAYSMFLLENVAVASVAQLTGAWINTATLEAQRHFGADRFNMAFVYNLIQHMGGHGTMDARAASSSSSSRDSSSADDDTEPGCWLPYAHKLPASEAFDAKQCPDDDVWPCVFRQNVNVFKQAWSDLGLLHAHLNVRDDGTLEMLKREFTTTVTA